MKTILIAARKGGAGKTTLSRNLAVAATLDKLSTLMLDLDDQQSLRAWWESRDNEVPAMIARDPKPADLRQTLEAAARKFDLTVIDTPPRADAWLDEAFRLADLVLIPVRPSPTDMRAIGATLNGVRNAGTPYAFVLSQTTRTKVTDDAARAIASHGPLSPTNLALRIIHARTDAMGQGVQEATDPRAAAEMRLTWKYVKEMVYGEEAGKSGTDDDGGDQQRPTRKKARTL